MKKIVYNFREKAGLNYGKGVRVQPMLPMPKGKYIDYYHKTRIGLGYVSDLLAPAFVSDDLSFHDHSSNTSC